MPLYSSRSLVPSLPLPLLFSPIYQAVLSIPCLLHLPVLPQPHSLCSPSSATTSPSPWISGLPASSLPFNSFSIWELLESGDDLPKTHRIRLPPATETLQWAVHCFQGKVQMPQQDQEALDIWVLLSSPSFPGLLTSPTLNLGIRKCFRYL